MGFGKSLFPPHKDLGDGPNSVATRVHWGCEECDGTTASRPIPALAHSSSSLLRHSVAAAWRRRRRPWWSSIISSCLADPVLVWLSVRSWQLSSSHVQKCAGATCNRATLIALQCVYEIVIYHPGAEDCARPFCSTSAIRLSPES